MKIDINNRADIISLVDTFYGRVEKDTIIGPIFTQVIRVDWAHHLPKMYDFWESVLFGKAIYKGNPMLTHFDIDKKASLKTDQFEAWKTLFFNTVDDLFEGENASTIKQKAQSIADLMHFKLNPPKPGTRIM
ncbi:group III truncated hemoglobin [Pedobacter endophyticus]|uniref:Group III truncated hemoglobin n=1 Tax=Pedobacter endophyticus TaxID=2789740 RepID=A0A7S9Q054_9SPHI|nr:group III truncated hemoglobin [Pedobacter endophyticus]QPH41033.1 group III truncated hemoglobin [Pedobacter endophyticus]